MADGHLRGIGYDLISLGTGLALWTVVAVGRETVQSRAEVALCLSALLVATLIAAPVHRRRVSKMAGPVVVDGRRRPARLRNRVLFCTLFLGMPAALALAVAASASVWQRVVLLALASLLVTTTGVGLNRRLLWRYCACDVAVERSDARVSGASG